MQKKLTPSRLRKTDTACTKRSSGEGGGEGCLLTDAVSKIHVVGGPKKYLVRINNKLD